MSFDNPALGEQSLTRNPKRNGANPEVKGKGILAQRKHVSIGDLPELPAEDKDLEDGVEKLQEGGKTFSQLLEESSKGAKFQEGEVVEGLVVKADRDYVTIDIGYKS